MELETQIRNLSVLPAEQKINIMIYACDDDQMWRLFIEDAIIEYGTPQAQYRIFSDPQELLNQWNEDVHLCIVDFDMKSKMTGIDLIREVHKRNPICYIVLLSAAIQPDTVIDAFNDKLIDNYVDKSRSDAGTRLRCAIEKGIIRLNEFARKLAVIIERTNKVERKLNESNSFSGNS